MGGGSQGKGGLKRWVEEGKRKRKGIKLEGLAVELMAN